MNMKKNSYKTTVGTEPIHAEQCQAGETILSLLTVEEDTVPILVAQPQQGKTGAAIYVIDRFIKTAKLENKTFRVIYLTNMSDNDLRNQVRERMERAWLDDDVEVLHLRDLDDIEVEDVDRTLIVTDECHYAIDKDCRFHRFLKDHGIEYGMPRSTWRDRSVFLLPISATPFAHVVLTQMEEDAFSIVPLPLNEGYYSLKCAWEDGRLMQSEPIINGKNRPTPFLARIISDFNSTCAQRGAGYLVIRLKGDKQDALRQFIAANHPWIRIRGYSSTGNDDGISRLDTTLSIEPERPTVVLIKDGMRAGKTLTTTKYIHGWYESSTSKADAMLQSLRPLGYGKHGDTFPIYCNTTEVQESIGFYDDLCGGKFDSMIPSGIRNKASHHRNRWQYEQIIFDSMPTIGEISTRAAELGIEVQETDIHFHPTSTQAATPALRHLLANSGYQQGADGSVTVYHVNGYHDNFFGDYEMLSKEKPDLIGKHVALVRAGSKQRELSSVMSKKAIFSK